MQNINKNSSNLRFFEAAKILFADNDPNHITVDMLCKKAKLKRITFYKHFESKDDFLVFCVNHVLEGSKTLYKSDFYSILFNVISFVKENYQLMINLKKGGYLELCARQVKNKLQFLLNNTDINDSERNYIIAYLMGILYESIEFNNIEIAVDTLNVLLISLQKYN